MGLRDLFRPSARPRRPRLLLAGSLQSLLETLAREADAHGLEVVGRVDRESVPAAVAREGAEVVLVALEEPLDAGGSRDLAALIREVPDQIVVAIDPLGKVALRTVLVIGEIALPQRVLDLVQAAMKAMSAPAEAPATTGPEEELYSGAEEHLQDELRWLGLRLRGALRELAGLTAEQDARRDELVEALKDSLGGESCGARAADTLRSEIDRRARRSVAAGRRLRLRAILRGFDEVESDCLLLALACAREPAVARVVDFLGGSEGALVPMACWLALPGRDLGAFSRALDEDGPLAQTACLIGSGAPARWRIDPVLERCVVHGADLSGAVARPATGGEGLGLLWADPDLVTKLSATLAEDVPPGPAGETAGPRPLILSLTGPEGSGRRALALRSLAAAGLGSCTVDVHRLLAAGSFELELRRVARSAYFRDALVLDHFDALARMEGEDGRSRRAQVEEAMSRFATRVVLVCDRDWAPEGALRSALFVRFAVPPPRLADGPRLWRAEAEARGWPLPDALVQELGSRFRLWPGDVRAAASLALGTALCDSRSRVPGRDELFGACRSRTGLGLADYATRLEPRHRWDELVLAPRSKRQVCEFVAHVEQAPRVFGEWGFGRTLARDRGATALFSGPSGTGKTMAAEVVAQRLGLELWRIDLACVLSKYVSETEQNLSEIFARADNCILLFDEAESLFSQRTEVRDAHDRYANVEVAHLLQLLEEYQGVAILATNLRRNLDAAFVRRIRFVVEFALPNAAQRERIWRQSLPVELPLQEDVRLGFLAEHLELSGGSIRNAAVRAAFLAAATGAEVVGMRHLVRASVAELVKTGKPFDPARLAPFDTCIEVSAREAELLEACA